jgi:uncharacterized membrane protein YhhN
VAKPAVLVALLVAAVASTPAPGSPEAAARPWLVAGLAASLAGDVLLLPPGRFVGGLVAFLLAHLAYLAAFLVVGVGVPWLAAGALGAAVVGATVGVRLVRAAGRAGLAAPVAVYLVAILAMAVAATGTARPAAIAGAWLFVTSDALLGWGRFGRNPTGRPVGEGGGGGRSLRLGVIVTYHAAQLLILLALAA